MLVSTKTPIEGQKLSFVNDLTVTRDGRKIYFTDSSSKWQRQDYLFLIMEGTDDGRQVSPSQGIQFAVSSVVGEDLTTSLIFTFFSLYKHTFMNTALYRGGWGNCVAVANETCSKINQIPLFPSRGLAWFVCFKNEGVSITFSPNPSWMLPVSSALLFLLCS